jgi:hypothetical protein
MPIPDRLPFSIPRSFSFTSLSGLRHLLAQDFHHGSALLGLQCEPGHAGLWFQLTGMLLAMAGWL